MRPAFTRGRVYMGIKHEKKKMSTPSQGQVDSNKYKCKFSKLSFVYQKKKKE